MEFKGSRTEQNLLAAFSGESMARNKYLFFAEKARQEQHPEVAELFEQMAQNEGIHGRLLYQRLKGVGSSAANLQEAIQGEYGEWSSMYPSFAQIAREEGFEEVGMLFDQISKIEKDHEFRFLAALAKLNSSGGEKTAAPAVSAPKPAVSAAPRTVTVQGYRCMFCGATYENRPDVCHVCQAIGSFEPTTIQKCVDD
jgi:rubrerythrin